MAMKGKWKFGWREECDKNVTLIYAEIYVGKAKNRNTLCHLKLTCCMQQRKTAYKLHIFQSLILKTRFRLSIPLSDAGDSM